MKNISKLILITLIIITSNALSKSLFDTEYYEIKFKSTNIEEGKKNKIYEIKFISIDKIFKNILLQNDYNTISKNINEDLINYFIKNILIKEEKIINNNYYSKVKVNFNKKKIINFLKNNDLNFVDYLPDNFLLIIFDNNKISKNYNLKKNTHYNFLLTNKKKFNNLLIPKFDINDKYILNNFSIDKDTNKINKINNKYGVENSIIIFFDESNQKISYSSYLYSNNNLLYIETNTISNYDYYNLFLNILDEVNEEWKKNNIIDQAIIYEVNCDIKYYNILELKEIKSKIGNISTVNEFALNKISFQNNSYKINYFGNSKILMKLIKMSGLNIRYDDNSCKISLK